MKIKKGDLINDLSLPSIDGTHFKIQEHKGKKIFLTFYRFAACPFCNLRINEIIKRYDEFGDNFLMVGIIEIFFNKSSEYFVDSYSSSYLTKQISRLATSAITE